MKKSSVRKPISILLSLLMVLSVFGGLAFSASAESSGTYDGFNWTLNDDGALTFTGSGSIRQDNAWYRKGEITSVTATGAIEQVNGDAFFGNQNATSYTSESNCDLRVVRDAIFVYYGSKMETVTITAPKITLTGTPYYNYNQPMELTLNGDVYFQPGTFSEMFNLSVHVNGDLYVVYPADFYIFSGPGAADLQNEYNYLARYKMMDPYMYEDILPDILARADENGCTYTHYEEETAEALTEENAGLAFGSTYVAAQPDCVAEGTRAHYFASGLWDYNANKTVDCYYLYENGYENGTYVSATADDLVMAPTGHDYTDAEWTYVDADQHVRYCTVCNEPEYEAHDVIVKGAGDATCVDEGYTGDEFCSVCGERLSEGTIIPAKGHTDGDPVAENVVPATCTKDGSYDVVTYCTVCGEETHRVAKTEKAFGHTTEIVGAKEATDTEDGYTGDEVCTVCGETIKAGEVIPATGDTTPDEPDDGDACPYCGKVHAKKWVRIVHLVLWFLCKTFHIVKK